MEGIGMCESCGCGDPDQIHTPAQVTADAAEDSMIRRYRERRVPVGQGLTVSCGRCGTAQTVHPGPGVQVFALVCASCRARTLFDVSHAR
jgi:ribosomal protein S27E